MENGGRIQRCGKKIFVCMRFSRISIAIGEMVVIVEKFLWKSLQQKTQGKNGCPIIRIDLLNICWDVQKDIVYILLTLIPPRMKNLHGIIMSKSIIDTCVR